MWCWCVTVACRCRRVSGQRTTTLTSGVLAPDLRAVFVIPFLQAFVAVSAFLSSMVAADRMFHVYIALYWRLLSRKKPIDKWAGRSNILYYYSHARFRPT